MSSEPRTDNELGRENLQTVVRTEHEYFISLRYAIP